MTTYNFIEKYKVSSAICDNFIQYHKDNTEYKAVGKVNEGEVNKNIKDSVDVYFYNGSQTPFILEFFEELNKAATEYTNKYNINNYFKSDPLHIVQHYKPGQGYFYLHYEREGLIVSRRQLVYMLYCNNLKDGGTEFPFQKKKLKAIKGDLYFWPADFTHPHKGIISNEEEKYIATGWFNII
tara:strand:- start:17 stop:562 length:546 start_codon:yes stop_codon:yes gene_type:complete